MSSILIFFEGIQALALLAIAFILNNIWKKIEWEPKVEWNVENMTEAEFNRRKMATAEKKFRATVYENQDRNR